MPRNKTANDVFSFLEDTMMPAISAIKEKLDNDVMERLEALESEVQHLKDEIEELKPDHDSSPNHITDALSDIKKELTTVNDTISTVKASVKTVHDTVTTVDNSVNELKGGNSKGDGEKTKKTRNDELIASFAGY